MRANKKRNLQGGHMLDSWQPFIPGPGSSNKNQDGKEPPPDETIELDITVTVERHNGRLRIKPPARNELYKQLSYRQAIADILDEQEQSIWRHAEYLIKCKEHIKL